MFDDDGQSTDAERGVTQAPGDDDTTAGDTAGMVTSAGVVHNMTQGPRDTSDTGNNRTSLGFVALLCF